MKLIIERILWTLLAALAGSTGYYTGSIVLLWPRTVPSTAITVASHLCGPNEGVHFIERGILDDYEIGCRNTARFTTTIRDVKGGGE